MELLVDLGTLPKFRYLLSHLVVDYWGYISNQTISPSPTITTAALMHDRCCSTDCIHTVLAGILSFGTVANHICIRHPYVK